MTYSLQLTWRDHAARANFHRKPTFTEAGLVLGTETVLVPSRPSTLDKRDGSTGLTPNEHDRLVCLLATASEGEVSEGALLQIGQAITDWRRGDKALAAIRIGFLTSPRIESEVAAYRLFLAKTALDTSLSPYDLLTELGYSTQLLKYPGQPREPKGISTGGCYAGGAAIVPAFLDTNRLRDKPAQLANPANSTPTPLPNAIAPELDLLPQIGAPLPLPFLEPRVTTDNKDKEGPSFPLEAEDRRNGPNPNAEAWEHFVHRLVNPSDPTKDEHAYYLPNAYYPTNPKAKEDVSFDDCKKTNEPSIIPGLHKGDMVEAKDWMFNKLFTKSWSQALDGMADQIRRQNKAIEIEGLGRHMIYCFDGKLAASIARERYMTQYPNSRFLDCRVISGN